MVPVHRREFGLAFIVGKVEPGEAVARAVERETEEESGLVVQVDKPVHVETHGRWRVHTFITNTTRSAICNKTEHEMEWFHVEELQSMTSSLSASAKAAMPAVICAVRKQLASADAVVHAVPSCPPSPKRCPVTRMMRWK